MSEAHRTVEASVFALVPEFEQVLVRDSHGFQYALTPRTEGVVLSQLQPGQQLSCVVTVHVPRVLSARLVGPRPGAQPP